MMQLGLDWRVLRQTVLLGLYFLLSYLTYLSFAAIVSYIA